MININSKQRFTSKPKYKDLFNQPPFLVSKQASIWVKNNNLTVDHLTLVRFGVVVAKKHVKMAVARNKAKRLAREIFKEFRSRFRNKDLVIVIKYFVPKLEIKTWKQDLYRLYTWLDYFVNC